jgi:GAF domain-containing protein
MRRNKSCLPVPLGARLSGFLQDRSFASVPLLHQQQSVGRLFLTDEATFSPRWKFRFCRRSRRIWCRF